MEIYLPEGSTLEQTASVSDRLEQMLMKDGRVVNVATFVGTSSPRFHTTYAPNFPARNYAQLVVNTQTADDALALLQEYESKHRDIFPDAYVCMKHLDLLSTAAPIEVRISGNDKDSLKIMAQLVKGVLARNPNVIATYLAASFSGLSIGTIWEGDYPVTIKLMNEEWQKDSFDYIANQQVKRKPEATPGVQRLCGNLGKRISKNLLSTASRNQIGRDVRPPYRPRANL